ncbi:MAG: threonine--tRNA ligase [Alphaproteobacteria bacterium]|nr:threonine--tRNA ligase [Alphaproteobacteria bacterium]MBR3912895.1 threonine--tRNA ligase [Alphaproteobacteria bacterium]
MIEIKLPDGSKMNFDSGVNGLDIAYKISEGLAKNAVAIQLNDNLTDLTTPITTNTSVSIITTKNPEALPILRHTAAHVLAHAVTRLYPSAQVTIGPAVENGFYYDFFGIVVKESDLPKIEEEMSKIIEADYPIVRSVVSREEAVRIFTERNEKYKLEILNEMPEDVMEVSLYTQDDYVELCRGPHLTSTGKLGKAFKLTKVSASYWRGDSSRESLQRIYGTAFFTEKELKNYFTMLEEAEKRDHRKLGKEMDFFHFEEYAPGDVFWHQRGWTFFQKLIEYMRRRQKAVGYEEVNTPQIMNRVLWETSGHWNWYKENMFTTTIEEKEFAIKPMNCPGSVLIYKQGITSYRDLPRYIGEFGRVHRYEASGALHGLLRVRAFTQDDAHIFCTPEQLKTELQNVVALMISIYKDFGMTDMQIKLSTRPTERIGSDEIWDLLETALADALTDMGYTYTINEGDGAFYGPKLDFKFKDAIGREWQLGTLQADLNLPERFDISYIGEDGEKHRPIMLHRALFGSLERFAGVLLENTAGHLPFWLAPVPVMVMPVTEEQNEYAKKIQHRLRIAGIDAETDLRNEKISYKVREHSLKKIPVQLVVGKKEAAEGTVTIRRLGSDKQTVMSFDDALKQFKLEVRMPGLEYED